jgi:N-acetylglucosaminyldiphosphoundecaprenol N-acetyl-beta-D-mannosaminyltransferase
LKQVEKKVARIDGIAFFGGSARECLAALSTRLGRGEQVAVYTPNPVMMENAARDLWLHAALARADLNLPDGIGVVLAARLLGESVKERISGVDMAKGVLVLSARRGYRVFLLGGKEGVAREAAARLAETLPELCVCGTRHGYFSEDEAETVLEEIRRAKPDVLFVCLGSPKQESFIDRYRGELPDVKLFMALGGTLDVLAGRVRRAPLPIQTAGLEWLWRMVLEPRRLRDLPKMVAFSCRILKKSCHSAQSEQIKKSILKKN